MTDSQQQWESVTGGMPKPVSDWWWTEISKKYNEDGRDAHDIHYLQSKLDEVKNISALLNDVNAFILALFFQYFHYDTKDPDSSSKNLESFDKFSTEAAIPKDGAVYNQVKNLLETYSTDEHKTEGAYGENDVHYFLDLDMAWLGRSPEAFKQSIDDAMREYSYLETAAYKRLIQRVLQSFLMIPNIYATKVFRDKYETQARKNIAEEVKRLSC